MKKEYIWLSKAWYAETCLKGMKYKDDILIIYDDPDNEISGELAIRWYSLGTNDQLSARLEVFDDAFKVMRELFYLLDELIALGTDIQPEEVKQLLDKLGFNDITPFEREERK